MNTLIEPVVNTQFRIHGDTRMSEVMSALELTSYPSQVWLRFFSDDAKTTFIGVATRSNINYNCSFYYTKYNSEDVKNRYINTNSGGAISVYDPDTSQGVYGWWLFERMIL